MTQPVIVDTDIGNDIDDSWALAMALRSPELDVRLITASTGEPLYRAALVAELLATAGRSDIPIGIGCPGHSNAEDTLRVLEDRGALDGHAGGVVDAVPAIIAAIEAGPAPVTVLALGPLTTVAAVLAERPDLAARARLVGMEGSLRVGYHRRPGAVAEYNVEQDVDAARRVFAAPWTCTLTPLDTCGTVLLRGDRYQQVRAAAHDPLLALVLRHQRTWMDWWGRPEDVEAVSGVLFDTVAVHLCYDESLVEIETVGIDVDDAGIMRPADDGPRLRLATRWRDEEAFLDHLVGRLLRPAVSRS